MLSVCTVSSFTNRFGNGKVNETKMAGVRVFSPHLFFWVRKHNRYQVIFVAPVFVAASNAQGLLHSGAVKAATTGGNDQSFL